MKVRMALTVNGESRDVLASVHKTLLGANVVIVEGLDLRGVVPGQYELVCAPIKLLNGDGAPARVLLIER